MQRALRAAWHAADLTRIAAAFVQAMRQGKRPDGSEIHPFMPWRTMGQLRDDELHALWTYLHQQQARPKLQQPGESGGA